MFAEFFARPSFKPFAKIVRLFLLVAVKDDRPVLLFCQRLLNFRASIRRQIFHGFLEFCARIRRKVAMLKPVSNPVACFFRNRFVLQLFFQHGAVFRADWLAAERLLNFLAYFRGDILAL